MTKWDKLKATLKKWWPTILPILVTLWTALGPQVKDWVNHHPSMMVLFSAASVIVAHLLRSPLTQPCDLDHVSDPKAGA